MDQTTNLLTQLIAIKSFSGHEAEIKQFVTKYFTRQKIKVVVQGKNLVVKITGVDSTRAIIFDGHLDTVLPGSLDNWQSDPFQAKLVGPQLFGLGASDMKGGVAAMMLLAQKLSLSQPPCDIFFAFVVKEELDGSGSKNFVNWFTKNHHYQSVSAVICDTTGPDQIEIGHLGNAFVRVITTGQSGHGSQPGQIKDHAILKMMTLINQLPRLGSLWQQKYRDKYLGKPTIGLTGIKSGSFNSPNKFPDGCIAQFDIRTTPSLFQNLDTELLAWMGDQASFKFVAKPAPSGWCDPSETIIAAVKRAVPNIKVTISHGATDQCFFSTAGIPALIYGPGVKSICHQSNEYLNVADIPLFIQNYQKIINNCYTKL